MAATGPRGLALVAEVGDLWITTGDPATPGFRTETEAFATWQRQLGGLDEACARAGRPPGGVRRLLSLGRAITDPYGPPQRLADLVGRAAEIGFTDVLVPYPRPAGLFAGDPRDFEGAVPPLTAGPGRPEP